MSKKKPDFTYTVLEKNKEDFKQSKIVKKNVEVEFTLADVEKHEKLVRKQLKEAKTQMDVHAAEMFNISEHHPFVKDFTEEQYHTLEMYIEAMRKVAQLSPAVEAREKALEEYALEVQDIYKQCKFELPMEEEKKDVVEEATPEVEEAPAEEAAE
jgi:galactokinase